MPKAFVFLWSKYNIINAGKRVRLRVKINNLTVHRLSIWNSGLQQLHIVPHKAYFYVINRQLWPITYPDFPTHHY